MALTNGAKKTIWLRKLLVEIQNMDNNEPTKLLCDNQIVIKLSKNLVFHDRTKHLAIKHHFIREKVAKKEIEVVHVASLS
jgi:CRISPR/Cas system-associated protein Cas7 (RAMP superfamily)